jgi:FkbH-like protein
MGRKKVIVCDLDNTLWSGVIGEGAVEHFQDRQHILKALRKKGILLAISSKNNPANVHWTGGVLSDADFVSAQINWDPKVLNMRRIANELNLKLKDFLFIDDRADERAMVADTLPEVQTLDAESPDVWRRLAVLAEMLPEPDEMDRTLAYKQREERMRFLEDTEAVAAEQRELFRKLNLKLTIRAAAAKELRRVAELINRTNQFNLCGTRTTTREVTEWSERSDRSVLVVEAADKFGSMGIVCVAVTARTRDTTEIPVLVLSCRVFGYGVEKALLNYIYRSIESRGDGARKVIVGSYRETPQNEPCRKFYPDSGFIWEGGAWVCRGELHVEDPDWLTVDSGEVWAPVPG